MSIGNVVQTQLQKNDMSRPLKYIVDVSFQSQPNYEIDLPSMIVVYIFGKRLQAGKSRHTLRMSGQVKKVRLG